MVYGDTGSRNRRLESLAEILAAVSQMRDGCLKNRCRFVSALQMEVADSSTQKSNYTAWYTTLP